MPSGRCFPLAFGIYTRLTASGVKDRTVRWVCTAKSILAWEVSATFPSMPAVVRPALRCATWRTLRSVLDQLRSISFCRLLTWGQLPSFGVHSRVGCDLWVVELSAALVCDSPGWSA